MDEPVKPNVADTAAHNETAIEKTAVAKIKYLRENAWNQTEINGVAKYKPSSI